MDNEIKINAPFIPTEFGWVSPETPPVNHNNVAVLIWDIDEEYYQEVIGFYEQQQWYIEYSSLFKVRGWIPLPFSPHNK